MANQTASVSLGALPVASWALLAGANSRQPNREPDPVIEISATTLDVVVIQAPCTMSDAGIKSPEPQLPQSYPNSCEIRANL